MIPAVIMSPFSKDDQLKVAEGFEKYYDFTFCDSEVPMIVLNETEVIIGQAKLDMIQKAPKLKWVQGAFAGVDNLLKQGAFPENVTLTNVTGAFGFSIAEHMLGMVLTMYKNIHLYLQGMKNQSWSDLGKENTLLGKTVLIIGAGDIGETFAKLISVFDTHTIGIRRTSSDSKKYFDEMYAMPELTKDDMKALIHKSDLIAVCLPSTNETRYLLNAELLDAMKEDAMIINVGRGDTIVTDDLVKALKEQPKRMACLDVVDPEPLPKDHPLWYMENVMITPHVSGGSFGHLQITTDKLIDICRENLRHYAKGEEMINKIDLKAGYVVK